MIGLILSLLGQTAPPLPAALPCTAAETAELTAASDQPVLLACRAVLSPDTRVTRRIVIEGEGASGAGIDCRGGALGVAGAATTTRAPTVYIVSQADGTGWRRPTDVRIENCTVHGAIRIWGMGAGGSMRDLLPSSRTAGHTAAAQAAAPTRIQLTNLTFAATGSIPLYVGPGVTRVSVQQPRFTGRSVSTAVYLDAESAENAITGGVFDIRTGREMIAVDGSARNRITGNRFALRGRGGVFLYRNCGEDGVIRHQTPSGNTITDNVFTSAGWFRRRAVVVGAREGNRRYCRDDAGWPFGSSADDGDHATGNIVAGNTVSRF
ncbi:MAG TPA: right-handed parallel beta-helix repeat-containing protein [Brevundimonas sp.]|uniref:right-handed parallel beta-helix repeat-containing protein n=1 Tax=Brevundimonas sp. TaxID=1871086 RepID=UPI00262C0E05|nr:right-handed parallel beta-helix repeat-containing protein [Brevundimonas sp.]HRO32887.1 right-handed parallel beta-helix repeat-containing protein [Brevundimonas sp.]